MSSLELKDNVVARIIELELERQKSHIELIASENFVSQAVLEAQGSILTNKYAEGYSGRRYYGGCEYVDMVEDLAIQRLKEIFGVKYANVQPHSGSQANMASYRALLKNNDVILGMSLSSGGHLTHGFSKSFSGIDYIAEKYEVDEKTGLLDYEKIKEIALRCKPKLIIAGASAYSRFIDFKKFREIADLVGAYLLVDMAHIAGLVAGGVHPNPCEYAHVVTSTTHKTLRGPRGGFILTNDEKIAKKIDSVIFPGTQGGPLMHVIAAKAVAFKEALDPSFKEYAKQVVINSKALASSLKELGYIIISGGTDNHLLLVDVKKSVGITGIKAQEILDRVNITCNKNTIPGETEKSTITSGIRLGVAAMTTRGFKELEIKKTAYLIDKALKNYHLEETLEEIKQEVVTLMDNFKISF